MPIARSAAQAMLDKLEKYEPYLNSRIAMVALSLDPSIPNQADDVLEMKRIIRMILARDYGVDGDASQNDVAPKSSPSKRASLLSKARRARCPNSHSNSESADEVDDFFEFTSKADETVDDPIEWWAVPGHQKRFPKLSLLARDVLMCMGSSVPSEAAFSDSGGMVTNLRGRLSDDNISKMMKLRSWNRLMKKF